MRRRLVKLVRDRVGQFIAGDQGVSYEPVYNGADHQRLLRAKLLEEAVEYLQNPSLGELADVLQAVHDLAVVDLAAEIDALEAERVHKLEERGGFAEGTGMYVTTTAPPRHEGEHG